MKFTFSKLPPFTQARLKLAGWYSLTFAIIVIIFTIMTLSAKQSSFVRVYQVVENTTNDPVELVDFQEQFDEFDAMFKRWLFYFDTGIIVLSMALSYWLSGKTLQPIQDMVGKQQSFASDASHELRTPLTVMKMEITATKKNSKATNIQSLLNSLEEEVDHMTAIIQGLLALVRISSDNQPRVRVNLSEIVQKACDHTARHFKHSCQIQLDSTDPVRLISKPHQIQQILTILLDNASKYTGPKPKVLVTIKKHQNHVSVLVSDNGPGIPKAMQRQIFTRFFRGQADVQGSGLGLSIAKELAEANQGELTLEKSGRDGSVFNLSLPLK